MLFPFINAQSAKCKRTALARAAKDAPFGRKILTIMGYVASLISHLSSPFASVV
jgi:hypothetical protein